MNTIMKLRPVALNFPRSVRAEEAFTPSRSLAHQCFKTVSSARSGFWKLLKLMAVEPMKRYILIVLLCWTNVALATISVHINPPTVQQGEAFRLILTIEAPQSNGIPNLIPLQENFTIVGTERSMLYSIINGQTHAVSQWTVLLTAKKTGVLPIPPIQIGSQQSMASSIEVTEEQVTTPDSPAGDTLQDAVMLKADANLRTPFVNQQVIYTVKLYNNQRLLEAEYMPPKVEDALLVPLGEGRRYETTLNGSNYSVEEQQYAIFPQKSGVLNIVAPSFKALVFDAVPRRVKVQPKTIPLMVKPRPANYSGKDWLPASQVALTETYDQTESTMRQGNTLVRTIILQAAGVPAQLLPIFKVKSSSQFNAYAEKPELHNTAKQHELIGRATIKVTYLLNKAGRITIPVVSVPWFNTDTGKEENASLPARTLEVEAVAGGGLQPTTALAKPLAPLPTVPLAVLSTEKSNVWAWWLAGSLGLVLLVILVGWGFGKRLQMNVERRRLVLKELHEACANNKPNQAQAALLHWARLQWPGMELLNLHHLAKLVPGTALKKQLSILSKALYSEEPSTPWQGDALWRSVRAYVQIKPTVKSKGSDLPPINPGP